MNGLYVIKPWFVRRLRRLEDVLVARRVSPDSLTVVAVVVSVLAGAAIAAGGLLDMPSLWLVVPPLVLARLALNALDGSVARRTHRARPFGAALNELGDRASDAALLGSAAFVTEPSLALGAVAASGVASISGVTAQAITGRRDCGGPLGKADRAVVFAAGALVGALLGSTVPLVVGLIAIIVGALATVVARTLRLRAALRAPAFPAPQLIDIPDEDPIEEESCYAIGR